ncbi:integrin alpha-3b [Austrofundulus limnaeus]|uniref:Integrin alpha-3b n=1 Tax=Austrofundulus limnaeus TaxID=52670 RepID=A0A2I4D5Q7_AUSLI|nr:PREDICTED: integrin alpha-3-like [Austrofundulus limnaeus]
MLFPRLSALLCAVLAARHGTQTCSGFNIDERFPVIKEGKTKGSFFGFSVALHEQTKGSKKYLLLAGAPKEKAISLQNVNETGAVYSCPITTDLTDCSRMDLVSTTSSSEIVEGMWLGVTVASQRGQPDGRVLACGHRYVKIPQGGTEEQRRMIGKCFVRSNDLTFDINDDWQTDSYEVCNPNNDMEGEGLCNMGISAGLTDTDVYIGATGSYRWRGNVHVTWRNPDPLYSWDSNHKTFGDLKNRDSYIGYSTLEEQKLLSQSDYTVLTGAPRDKSIGSVLFGTKTENQNVLNPVKIISGEQVGSYFGNCLAVTDLNNDDWNDLIVGAPFYFNRSKDQEGAVYIFMNENGSFQDKATMVLKGPSSSAFGFAVAAIGDVNQDGFQDFAVGAPFYKTGMVYIWSGSKTGISQVPSQVIEGRSVGSGLFQTFGYSISGGIDMDDSGYPDILVGSLDDHIALLRARPIIHLTKTFTAEPKIVDPNLCLPSNPCITVTLCMSFTLSNGNKDFKKNITVDYTVEADMERRSHRVRFEDGTDTYSGSMTLPSSKSFCHYLKLNVLTPVRDKLEPVVFSVNLSLQTQTAKSRRSLQNLDNFPILSQDQKLTQRAEINFQKECGTDNKCSSNLQMTAQFADNKGNPYPRKNNIQVLQFNSSVRRISVSVDVTNLPSPGRVAEDAHQTMLNISFSDALKYASVKKDGIECRFDYTVICELGNPLKANEKVSLLIVFETSGIDLYTKEIEAQLMLSTVSEQSDLRPVSLTMLIESTIFPSFTIKNPIQQTKFGGTVMGEFAMQNTGDVGSLVEFTFNVDTSQPLGDMGTLAVEFQWPYEVANGKWLLYLTKIVVTGESEMECNPAGKVVNERNLTLSENKSKRTKRQTRDDDAEETIQHRTVEPQAAITLLAPRKKAFLLDCSKSTANCVTFTCPLLNMSTSAKIYVQSRLWNSTMLEDYSNALRVTVTGQATLKLITDKPTIKMDNQTLGFTVEIEPEEEVEIPYELPLWIIISAAVAGIMLLGIIILIMWKLGFFKRSIYYRIMPKYRGVKIRRDERYQFNLGFQPEEPQKKYWITSWTEMQRCYY